MDPSGLFVFVMGVVPDAGPAGTLHTWQERGEAKDSWLRLALLAGGQDRL